MHYDALVVGAGIAGLLCARTLRDHGWSVAVLDKGRGVGGRMATRRVGRAVFDHGAQFFTTRSKAFQAIVAEHIKSRDIVVWSRGFGDRIGFEFADGHPRYRGAKGMTALPKALADGLEVHLGACVSELQFEEKRWNVSTESGKNFVAKSLVLTPPIPQSLVLLAQSGIKIDLEVEAELNGIPYDRSIALLIRLARPSWIPEPGAYNFNIEPVNWLADNHAKGISPERGALTVHLAPEASLAHWESDEAQLMALIAEALPQLNLSKPKEIQIHRWRYSKPSEILDRPSLYSEIPGPVIFAGDAFAAPRVEGAALSGLHAAEELMERVKL